LIGWLTFGWLVRFWLIFDWFLVDWCLINWPPTPGGLYGFLLQEPPPSPAWLPDWLLVAWLTFGAKQISYEGRRTCQNRRRGTQRPFLVAWLTFGCLIDFWLPDWLLGWLVGPRTAAEVHNDHFADQYFSWLVAFLISIFLISDLPDW